MTNPNSSYIDPLSPPNGIFDTDPTQSLQLLIDFKTNGTLLHAAVPIKDAVQGQIEEAHRRGIKWPVFQRDRVWQLLLDSGIDYLNADDVHAASVF
ncbi:hypothetical protein RQP46_002919 [Phenoliferia psychrophenolica]